MSDSLESIQETNTVPGQPAASGPSHHRGKVPSSIGVVLEFGSHALVGIAVFVILVLAGFAVGLVEHWLKAHNAPDDVISDAAFAAKLILRADLVLLAIFLVKTIIRGAKTL